MWQQDNINLHAHCSLVATTETMATAATTTGDAPRYFPFFYLFFALSWHGPETTMTTRPPPPPPISGTMNGASRHRAPKYVFYTNYYFQLGYADWKPWWHPWMKTTTHHQHQTSRQRTRARDADASRASCMFHFSFSFFLTVLTLIYK